MDVHKELCEHLQWGHAFCAADERIRAQDLLEQRIDAYKTDEPWLMMPPIQASSIIFFRLSYHFRSYVSKRICESVLESLRGLK